jgi:hypothetical protein
MIVTYLPAGGEPREWTFRPMEVSSREAELVEEYLAVTYAMWVKAFQTGSIKAQRIALWLLLRRDDPTLGLESVDYQVRELRCRFEGSEAGEMRLQVQDDPRSRRRGAGTAARPHRPRDRRGDPQPRRGRRRGR